MSVRNLFPIGLLLTVLNLGCYESSAPAQDVEKSAFADDPLYATCVESADEGELCGEGRTLYVCSSLPTELAHECGSAEDSDPPLVLPASLICCPTPAGK